MKTLGGRVSAPDLTGELTGLSQPPSWWGWACCPSQRTSPQLSAFEASGFGPSGFACPRPFSDPLEVKFYFCSSSPNVPQLLTPLGKVLQLY